MTTKLYRMEIEGKACPSGLKAKSLLSDRGIDFEEIILSTRDEVDAFKAENAVETTPQIWISGKRIGGYDSLLSHFNMTTQTKSEKSYAPVAWLFFVTAAMAIAANFAANNTVISVQAVEWFIAFSMCVLALQKFRDLDAFANSFLNYDLLAQKIPLYAKIYPFAEGGAGVLMIAGILNWMSIPVALFIGSIGAFSVYKAVYLDKKNLNCACVGGDSVVPLGFVSLLENIIMVGMAVWMIIKTTML